MFLRSIVFHYTFSCTIKVSNKINTNIYFHFPWTFKVPSHMNIKPIMSCATKDHFLWKPSPRFLPKGADCGTNTLRKKSICSLKHHGNPSLEPNTQHACRGGDWKRAKMGRSNHETRLGPFSQSLPNQQRRLIAHRLSFSLLPHNSPPGLSKHLHYAILPPATGPLHTPALYLNQYLL